MTNFVYVLNYSIINSIGCSDYYVCSFTEIGIMVDSIETEMEEDSIGIAILEETEIAVLVEIGTKMNDQVHGGMVKEPIILVIEVRPNVSCANATC